jgi:archaellum component FlaC
MGYASLREDILERLTEALSSLLRDEERRKRRRSTAEEEARLEAIKRVQSEIRRVLDEHLDIATTPGIELAQRVKDLEARISALTDEVERAKNETIEERTRTQAPSTSR